MDPTVFEGASRTLLADHPDDEQARMLQSPGLRACGRFYAFAAGDDVVVKLPAARVEELIAAGVGRPCAPRQGRPMREWVRLAPSSEQDCIAYLAQARAFVVGLPHR
jgi:hypothetical protein